MPITIDEFEEQPEDVLAFGRDTQPYQVLSFLARNPDTAFTQQDIREATGLAKGSVAAALSRLEDRDLVRHRGRYWAVAEDDRLAAVTAGMSGSSSSVDDDYEGDG